MFLPTSLRIPPPPFSFHSSPCMPQKVTVMFPLSPICPHGFRWGSQGFRRPASGPGLESPPHRTTVFLVIFWFLRCSLYSRLARVGCLQVARDSLPTTPGRRNKNPTVTVSRFPSLGTLQITHTLLSLLRVTTTSLRHSSKPTHLHS